MSTTTARRWFVILATAAVPLLAVAAAAGALWPGMYHRDPGPVAAQAIGQDWITLVVAVPILIGAMIGVRRGSAFAPIVALGVLGYATYGYVLYAFGSRHNELFLVYVAIVGTSVWGLVAGFVALAPRVAPRPPRLAWRWIGGFFVVCAALFALIWLADIVPALIRGETPATVRAWGTPTNGVYVLDLGLLLPIIGWTGVRLWRREPGAIIVAGVLLFKIATLGLAILAMGVSEVVHGGTVNAGMVGVFAVLTSVAVAAAAQYTWALRPAPAADEVAVALAATTRLDGGAVERPARAPLVALGIATGLTAIAGGAALIAGPDGRVVHLPTSVLAHSPFSTFLIPGLVLLLVVGVGNLAAGWLVARDTPRANHAAFAGGAGLLGWIVTEMIMLRTANAFQVAYLVVALVMMVLALRRQRITLPARPDSVRPARRPGPVAGPA